MARLFVFNLVTLDGYFKGKNGDISWHNFGSDEQKISDTLSNAGSTLIFGRVTYELMKGYWTSADAKKSDPVTANGMNQSKKYVFSRKLKKADWENTTLIGKNLVSEIKKLKKKSKVDLCILGSGQIVSQCAEAGLIDSYSILLNPIALGRGKTMFEGIKGPLKLKLDSVKKMKSGNVLLNYLPKY